MVFKVDTNRREKILFKLKLGLNLPLWRSKQLMNDSRLKPNDPYRGRTALITSKRCILYIYSTNIDIEYFKLGIYSPLFSLQNAVCFIILTYLVHVLFSFYIQGVLKFKKKGTKRIGLGFINFGSTKLSVAP